MYREIKDLNNYKQVNSKEFSRFFKIFPQKCYLSSDDMTINSAHLYEHDYVTYDTNEIVGIFRGANCCERFSSYWIRKDLAKKYSCVGITKEILEYVNSVIESIEYYRINKNNEKEWFLPDGTTFKWQKDYDYGWWEEIYKYLKKNEQTEGRPSGCPLEEIDEEKNIKTHVNGA